MVVLWKWTNLSKAAVLSKVSLGASPTKHSSSIQEHPYSFIFNGKIPNCDQVACLLFFRRPKDQKHLTAQLSSPHWMHLAVVACGDRLEETLIMLKSAVLFSNRKLKFHIFAEDSLKPKFERKVSSFQPFSKKNSPAPDL